MMVKFHGKKAKKENFKLCMLILKVDLNKSTQKFPTKKQ